jgi:conjugative transposon TraN protein
MMKRIICLLGSCFAIIIAIAQPFNLSLATDKTTSLVFPFAILHVDKGTRDVLAEQVAEVSNILLVKAGKQNFNATNLSVVTADGRVYSFAVNYQANPDSWVVQLPIHQKETVVSHANALLDNPAIAHGMKVAKWQIAARVAGIYIKDNICYYHLQLQNNSPLDYDIDLLRFSIIDKRKVKRSAVQENEVKPIFIAGNMSTFRANCHSALVIALEKFTIPDAKYLSIQIMEKNGGRHLSIKVNNWKILEAVPLPDFYAHVE